jgi:short-subunit dehydrogenase
MPARSPAPEARVVLVTGASSGIGRATAVQLAERGDVVALLARALEPLQEVAELCRSAGAAEVTVHPVDVGDAEMVDAAVADLHAAYGRIDAVVNSAGVAAYGRFEEVPREVFEGVLRTNLLGSANVARSVLPAMRAADSGILVLVGSVLGHIAVPTMSSYAVSKWAVRCLAHVLQLEQRDRSGVHVVTVEPGGVDTPIYRQAASYAGHIGRPPPPVVTPEEVARRIVAALDRPRKRVSVGPANDMLRLGFTLLPGVYDWLVGPLFAIAGLERRSEEPDGTGNVLHPDPHVDALRGDQGSFVPAVIAGVRREVAERLRRR